MRKRAVYFRVVHRAPPSKCVHTLFLIVSRVAFPSFLNIFPKGLTLAVSSREASAVWLFCPGGRLYDPLTPLHPPAKTNRLSLAFVNTAWFRVPPLAMMFRRGAAARYCLHRWRDARLRAVRASGDRRARPTSAGAMAWEGRAGRSGPMNMTGYRKSPSARICKRKGIRKAAMRWKEATT